MVEDSSRYEALTQPHRRALARLKLDLEFFLEESGPLLIIDVTTRLKTLESAYEKSKAMGLALPDLDDLAGLRVVCGTRIDADALCHFFRTGLRGTSFKVLKDNAIDRSEGYRAHHIVIEVDEAFTGTWQGCKVEVQIQTALQNAFNRLSREWLYKSDRDLPESLNSRFRDFAKALKKLDEDARELQIELFSSSQGQRDPDPLTPIAYRSLLKEVMNEETDGENAIWYTLYYRRCGIVTCGELRTFFTRQDILELYERWQAKVTDDHPMYTLVSDRQQFWRVMGMRPDWTREILDSGSCTKRDD